MPTKRKRHDVAYKGDNAPGWKASAVKASFYLPRELHERLNDVAWYERMPASQVVRQLIQAYVDARKRIPKRPKEEAD